MIFGIFLIIIVGVVVAAVLAYNYHVKEKKKAQDKIDRLGAAHIFKMKILSNLLNMRSKTAYKARLMEELSMEIEMLKVCVAQLKQEKLITEGPHVLTLTDFGKKYAQVYADEKE